MTNGERIRFLQNLPSTMIQKKPSNSGGGFHFVWVIEASNCPKTPEFEKLMDAIDWLAEKESWRLQNEARSSN